MSNLLIKFFTAIDEETIAERWFKWLGWLAAAAALYALGEASSSQSVKFLSYVSGALIFVSMLNMLDDVVKAVRAETDAKPIWLRLLIMPVSLIVSLYVGYTLIEAIGIAFELAIAKTK